MVNEKKSMTISVYLETFKDIVKKTAIRDLKQLIESGLIKKVGYKKGAYFCAIENVSKK